jgi:hypothetical protein
MKNKRLNSNESDFQIEVENGKVTRRKRDFLPDGAYFFEEDLDFAGDATAKVITCTAWLKFIFFRAKNGFAQTQNISVFFIRLFPFRKPVSKIPRGVCGELPPSDHCPKNFFRLQ